MTLDSGEQARQSSFGNLRGTSASGENARRADDRMVKDVQEVTRLAALLAEATGRMGSLSISKFIFTVEAPLGRRFRGHNHSSAPAPE